MGLFGAAHTYPTILKLGTVTPYLSNIRKRYKSRDTALEFCWQDLISNSFKIFWAFEGCFNKYGCNFDDVSKLGTLGLLKIKVFWNKGYDVIISVHDVTNKILSNDSSYIVDMVMWPIFGNSSISMREIIITSIL